MKFTLSKFKKIHSDQDSTTLKHPEGHTIKIDHANLRPELKKQLDGLSLHLDEGGMAEGANASEMPMKKDTPDQILNDAAAATSALPEEAQAPELPPDSQANSGDQKYAQMQAASEGKPVFDPKLGTMVFPNEKRYEEAKANAALGQIQNQNSQVQSQQDRHIGEMARQKEDAIQRIQEYKRAGVTPPQDVIARASLQIPSAQSHGAPSTPAPSNYQLTSAQSQGPNPGLPQSAQPNPDYFGSEAYLNAYQQGIGEQKAGITQEANAQAQAGRMEAAAAAEHMATMTNLQNHYEQQNNELLKERAAVQKDISDGHIDPQQYLHSMGAGQKVSTAIGLILGGIGGGILHQENPAMKFLNSQIENNIKGQQLELGKKENLLAINTRQMGNLRDGMQLTRLNQIDYFSAQLKRAAAQTQDPMAKARALQAAGQLDMQTAPIMSQLTSKRAMLSATKQGARVDPSLMVRFIVDKSEQPKAYEELKFMQEMNSARQTIADSFGQLTQLSTVGNKLNPQAYQKILALREPLVLKLARESAGKVNEYEMPGIRAMFPSAVDNEKTIAVKLRQLDAFTRQKMHAPILSGYGIDVPIAPLTKPMSQVPQNYRSLGQKQAPQQQPQHAPQSQQQPTNVNFGVNQ